MKLLSRITLLFTVFSICLVPMFAQNAKKDKAAMKAKTVQELIQSKEYKINVETAIPMSGKLVQLTSPYSVEIKNDSIYSYLPYYGRAYSIPYGGGSGLIFQTSIGNYSEHLNKKGKHLIQFSAETTEDSFNFTLTIFSNGSATVNVNMRNRQPITFHGDLSLEKKK